MCRKIRCDGYYAKFFGFWVTSKRGLSKFIAIRQIDCANNTSPRLVAGREDKSHDLSLRCTVQITLNDSSSSFSPAGARTGNKCPMRGAEAVVGYAGNLDVPAMQGVAD